MQTNRLTGLGAATAVATAAATGLIFFYAPGDADQGLVQKIFYLHVPMAIVALCGVVAAALMAIKHLRSGDRAWDMRSHVAIHLSIILGVGVLAAQLPGGAAGRGLHTSARPVHDGRPDAGRDATHLHRRADRHGPAVHDAVNARADSEAGGASAAPPAAPV
jgi:hypothetical protein